jgi:hypothetical protein
VWGKNIKPVTVVGMTTWTINKLVIVPTLFGHCLLMTLEWFRAMPSSRTMRGIGGIYGDGELFVTYNTIDLPGRESLRRCG